MPGTHLDWNLTPEQWSFIDAPVVPPQMPVDPSAAVPTPDPNVTYTGQRKGMAPWSKAYDCANQGYQVMTISFCCILFVYCEESFILASDTG